MELNITLFRMINDLGKEHAFLNPLFIFFAEYSMYFLAMAVILFFFTRNGRNRVMVVCAGLTFILAEVVGKLVSKLHTNYQPFAVLDDVNKLIEKDINNSFPSDHTILFFSFCMTFWLFSKSRYRFLWLVVAVLVALSRVGVGVHYPADITVGALISMVVSFIVYKVVPPLPITKRLFHSQASIERTKSKEL
ncbi:undecaprenyl-diphosphatase [Peribacillus sp. NPDC097206]|uniref:undecaprenyl-diphosphatase n=1 Tax=Peribacillus sp. NPDC097206 TaxID=3364398 RepID=UPI0038076C0D